jgi:aryl-alcohol dehydrogenase-like predicted oxidoreductase
LTSVEVPVIGQGTWMIEGNGYSELRGIETLRVGLELGMTHIDTAEMYGDGHTEEIVAEAISGQRDNVFLLSSSYPLIETMRAMEKLVTEGPVKFIGG